MKCRLCGVGSIGYHCTGRMTVGAMARVGVAISGGGHRAALFGLGSLMYLADAEKSREVVSIASASGGSITNGYVALRADYAHCDGEAFQER